MVAMLNTLSENNRTMTAKFSEIPGLQENRNYTAIDAWTGNSIGCVENSVDMSVDSHDTAVLLLQEGCSGVTTSNTYGRPPGQYGAGHTGRCREGHCQ